MFVLVPLCTIMGFHVYVVENYNSDQIILTMAMSANKTFQELVKKLYESDLHFLMTETPFYAQIMIRKKFLKHRTGPRPTATDVAASIANSEVIDSLRNKIIKLENNIKESSEVNDKQNRAG